MLIFRFILEQSSYKLINLKSKFKYLNVFSQYKLMILCFKNFLTFKILAVENPPTVENPPAVGNLPVVENPPAAQAPIIRQQRAASMPPQRSNEPGHGNGGQRRASMPTTRQLIPQQPMIDPIQVKRSYFFLNLLLKKI